MSSARRKFYVVWVGHNPGIYDSWDECKLQTDGFQGSRFKAFDNLKAATAAYRGKPDDHIGILKSIANRPPAQVNYDAFPEIKLNAIAVDGACSRNPGPTEYQGVLVGTGETIFKVGPIQNATNNIGEYLAIVHALAWLDANHDKTTPIYSDSRTALSWLRRRGHNSKLIPTPENAYARELLLRADRWLQAHPSIPNPVLKWDTENWGEIPADFGRK